MDSGIHHPPIRGFMDDLTVTTTNHIQAKWVLLAMKEDISWGRVKFKAKKSRYVSYGGRGVNRRVKRQIQGEEILSIIGIQLNDLMNPSDRPGEHRRHKEEQSMAADYLERTKHGSTSMGSYKSNVVTPHI